MYLLPNVKRRRMVQPTNPTGVTPPPMPVINGTGSTASVATGTTITIPVPAGTVDGDVLYMAVGNVATTPSVTTPAGWTPVYAGIAPVSNTAFKAYLFRRVASGEPANYVVTTASGRSSGVIVGVYNVNTTTPEQATSSNPDAVFGTSVSMASLTPAVDTLLLSFYLGRIRTSGIAANWTPDALQVMEDAQSSAVAAVANATHLLASEQIVSGATGTRTATSDTTLDWVAFGVALNPA